MGISPLDAGPSPTRLRRDGCDSRDSLEGLDAFTQKRTPEFEGT